MEAFSLYPFTELFYGTWRGVSSTGNAVDYARKVNHRKDRRPGPQVPFGGAELPDERRGVQAQISGFLVFLRTHNSWLHLPPEAGNAGHWVLAQLVYLPAESRAELEFEDFGYLAQLV